VKIHEQFFWVVTAYSVVGYQRFIGPCCLHLQGEMTGMLKCGIPVAPGGNHDHLSLLQGHSLLTSYWLAASVVPHPLRAYIYAIFPHPSHFVLKMEAAWTSETFVFYHSTRWHQNPKPRLRPSTRVLPFIRETKFHTHNWSINYMKNVLQSIYTLLLCEINSGE
jgi:hypothetical protein